MTPQKLNKAFSLARLDDLPSVRAHIGQTLQQQSAALAELTSRQIAAVIQIHHAAYKQGRASCGAELTGDGAVWIGGNVQRLIDLDRLPAP